jgi:hypothetical protein
MAVAQDGDRWLALVNAVKNLQVRNCQLLKKDSAPCR